MTSISRFTPWLDKFAVTTSAFCAIHCLCLPILVSVFPAVSTTIFGQESFHVLLLWFVIPFSLIALSMGCRKHKNRLVVLFGLVGLTILILAATFGHDTLGEIGERVATLVGAIVIAVGHLRNYALCRRVECDHEAESGGAI